MRSLIISCLMLAAVFCGCDSDPVTRSSGSTPPDLSVTPMADAEAEMAALWQSGEIVAPTVLYNRIGSDLAIIREQWGDSIAETAIQFQAWWQPSLIHMGFDSATYDSVMEGTYHAWDSLNELYRVTEVSSVFPPHITVEFEGRLNPIRLVDIYKGLPGAYYVQSGGTVGDRSVMLPVRDKRTMKYFFRNAWGDCPAGCIYSEIFYFTVKDDSVDYVGSLLLDHPYPEPTDWLDTFNVAKEAYFEFNDWHAETDPPPQ